MCTADQDGDMLIDPTELLRVIQFFNSDGYHIQCGTEDGYAPGQGIDIPCAEGEGEDEDGGRRGGSGRGCRGCRGCRGGRGGRGGGRRGGGYKKQKAPAGLGKPTGALWGVEFYAFAVAVAVAVTSSTLTLAPSGMSMYTGSS